jgi:hypothetical protein
LQVADGRFELLEGFKQAVERFELPDDALGLFLIGPEVGQERLLGELLALRKFGGDVKDCLGARSGG